MNRASTLILSGADHRRLKDHLFPGDGCEAAAILVCTRDQRERLKLLVREVVPVPHSDCARLPHRVTWPTAILDELQQRSEDHGWSLVLVHSHLNNALDFSEMDNQADAEIIPFLHPYEQSADSSGLWHGSAIMVPSGDIRARLYDRMLRPQAVDLVAIYGDELKFYWGDDFLAKASIVAFSDEMRHEMGRLSIAVIGISGTGSIVAEQLLRLGAGELIVIDPDHVEAKNLNRILNSTQRDASEGRAKVEVFRAAAATISPTTRVLTCGQELETIKAIELAAGADVVFCCVDSYGGRHTSDRLAAAMLQPLFDVGVVIPVRTSACGPVISNVCGRVDYVQPAGSSLHDREIYTPELLRAESLRRTDPTAYEEQLRDGYMPGAQVQAPSVITVNMRAASAVVQEFIARAYPYRMEANCKFARTEFDLASEEYDATAEEQFAVTRPSHYATGLIAPLLGLTSLEDLRRAP